MQTKTTNHSKSLIVLSTIAWIILIIVCCLYWWRINSNLEEKKEQNRKETLLNQINQLYIENDDYTQQIKQLDVEKELYLADLETKKTDLHGSAELNTQKIDELWREYYGDNEWHPWMLNKDGTAQVMPTLASNTTHERFKEMAADYWLDAWMIWEVENFYGIKEWVVLCITVAETSWWNRWAGWKNIGSVGSNDRWDRPTYALMEAWLEAIGKTLNNKYLWNTQTLWCLSNAWNCKENISARYATSTWNRERNMVACLSNIYWTIDPSSFSIRR